MARSVATLPAGSRLTDYISLGVIAKSFPLSRVQALLVATNRVSLRQRDLPAPVVMYYVIALALYMGSSYRKMLRCLLKGMQWLLGALAPWQALAGTNWSGHVGGMTPEPATYPGYRFPAEVIGHVVWLCHVFSLSLRDVELILAERGITVTR